MRPILIILACVIIPAAATQLRAESVPLAKARAMCAAQDTGPRTVYGETPQEAAAKRVMFRWTCMALIEGKPGEAFDTLVSRDYCEHSHVRTSGLKACETWADTRKMAVNAAPHMVRNGLIEFPTMATVNGELVTQFGEGVDIWRVHNGKITDHWDASPPQDIALKAHNQAFSDKMQRAIDTHTRVSLGDPRDM